jgi:hypothetical protein
VRAGKRKAPEGPRGRSKAVNVTKETKVSLAKRVEQFPDQGLKVSAGKIFCQPCKEELPNLKESIKRHIGSTKHQSKLDSFVKRSTSDNKLYRDLAVHFEEHDDEQGVSCSIYCMPSRHDVFSTP